MFLFFSTWTFSSRSVARQLTSEATAGTSAPVTTTVDVTTPVKPIPPGGVSVNGGVTPPVGASPLERLDNLIKVKKNFLFICQRNVAYFVLFFKYKVINFHSTAQLKGEISNVNLGLPFFYDNGILKKMLTREPDWNNWTYRTRFSSTVKSGGPCASQLRKLLFMFSGPCFNEGRENVILLDGRPVTRGHSSQHDSGSTGNDHQR